MIIALTTLMLIALLVLLPMRARVSFCLNLAEKVLTVRVKIFLITFFREKFTLDGLYLQCEGSVDTRVDIMQTDPSGSKYYLKAVVVDSVNVTLQTNYMAHSPFVMVALEGFVATATTVACAVSNSRICVTTQYGTQTAIFGEIRLSVTLAGVIIALLRAARHAAHRVGE